MTDRSTARQSPALLAAEADEARPLHLLPSPTGAGLAHRRGVPTAITTPSVSQMMDKQAKILRIKPPIHSKHDLMHPGQLWTQPQVASTFSTVLESAPAGRAS